MQRIKPIIIATIATSFCMVLSGCSTVFDKHVQYEAVAPEQYPVLSATGYASISAQHGESHEQKMLNAMQASKLLAYQELSEQLNGLALLSAQQLNGDVIDQFGLQTQVQGFIQGAKVINVYPVGEDTYATELSLDTRRMADLKVLVENRQRVKKVTYY